MLPLSNSGDEVTLKGITALALRYQHHAVAMHSPNLGLGLLRPDAAKLLLEVGHTPSAIVRGEVPLQAIDNSAPVWVWATPWYTPEFVHGLGFHGRRLRSRCPA